MEEKKLNPKTVKIGKIIIVLIAIMIIISMISSAVKKPKIDKFNQLADEQLFNGYDNIVESFKLDESAGTIHIYRSVWDNQSDANKMEFMFSISKALTKLQIDVGLDNYESYYPVTFYDEYGNKLGNTSWNGKPTLK